MILSHISNDSHYLRCHPDFIAAFSFLKECNLSCLSEGRHTILRDRIYAIVSKNQGKGQNSAKLEAHRQYIDIQYVVKGRDRIGWRSLISCKECCEPYQKEKDIIYFSDIPQTWIDVDQDYFAVFFPEDAHAPLAGESEVSKVVIKIAVTYDQDLIVY